MKEENFTIEVHGQPFSGTALGTGRNLLLCFPGFGAPRAIFKAVLPETDGWRILLMDLPGFHESEWHNPNFRLTEWVLSDLVTAIQQKYPHENLHLIGYSLGARVCTNIAQNRPELVSRVLLLAPDGLRTHPLYRFCTQTKIGRWLFSQALKWPGPILFVTRALHKLSLLSAVQYKLAMWQLGHPQHRIGLKKVWLGYALLEMDLDRLSKASRLHQIEWHVIWGKRDKVLPPAYGKGFVEALPDTKFELVDAGHLLLSEAKERIKGIITRWMQDW